MHASRRRIVSLLCGIAVGITAACGGTGSASLSPAAPSSSGSGATISGRVTGPTAASLAASARDLDTFRTMETRTITVSIVGTSMTTTTDGNGQFTLTNVPSGTVQLRFSASGSNATVTISGVGADDHVQIVVNLQGGNAKLESEHHSSPDNKGEFQGLITSIDAAAQSFQVSAVTVKVPTSATIRHGSRIVPFADLKVGNHVEVRGTREGSTITASEVKVESGDQGDDHEGDDQEGDDRKDGGRDGKGDSGVVGLAGAVSALDGSCPGVTFMLQATKVTASAATTYEHGSCATLKNTLRVEVKGAKAADGSVAATRISIDD